MQRATFDEPIKTQCAGRKSADAELCTVDCQWRDDGIDARAVRQAGINHRRAFIDPPSRVANDALDDMHQMGVIAKLGATFVQLATALYEHTIGADHKNVSDFLIGEERLKWSEPKDVIEYALHHLCAEVV